MDLGAGGAGPLGSLSSSSTIIERFGVLALAAAEEGVFAAGALECRIGDILPGSVLKVELLTPPDATLRFSAQKKGIIVELKEKDCLNL